MISLQAQILGMIQRIQSIYFLISILIGGALFFIPLASVETSVLEGVAVPEDIVQLYTRGYHSLQERLYELMPTYMLITALALHIVVTLAALLLYKNRSLQIKVAAGAAVTMIAFFGMMFYYAEAMVEVTKAAGVDYGLGTFLPGISLILIWMALKAIKKDDELIKSVDRLR